MNYVNINTHKRTYKMNCILIMPFYYIRYAMISRFKIRHFLALLIKLKLSV